MDHEELTKEELSAMLYEFDDAVGGMIKELLSYNGNLNGIESIGLHLYLRTLKKLRSLYNFIDRHWKF